MLKQSFKAYSKYIVFLVGLGTILGLAVISSPSLANTANNALNIIGFKPVKESAPLPDSPKPNIANATQKGLEFKDIDSEAVKQKTSFEVRKPNLDKLELVSIKYLENSGGSVPTQVVEMNYKFNNQPVVIMQGTNRNYRGVKDGEVLVPESVLKNAVPVSINGNKGFIKSSSEGAEIHNLYFNINGIGFTVWAENISKEDIIKIAESIN